MVLQDWCIEELLESDNLIIEPLDEDNIEPASVDLRLGDSFKVVERRNRHSYVNISTGYDDALVYHDADESIKIEPGQFVLASTKEYIKMPDNVAGRVLGRSSLGRLGISVHQTAGYIDPGFEGDITLELSNHGPAPVRLTEGDRICQLVLEYLFGSETPQQTYGHEDSQYQNQHGATPSGMQFD